MDQWHDHVYKNFEFFSAVKEIMVRIFGDGGRHAMSPKDLPAIISDIIGKEVNCYPGYLKGECHEFAFFISITTTLHHGRLPAGHITCAKAFEKIVQHFQGYCANTTRVGIMMTDNWDAAAYMSWKHNIKQIIRSGVRIEIYLVTWPTVSPICL